MSMINAGFADIDFSYLEDKYGVPVFVDNNANAAVVGCYVSQDEHENIALHRRPTGYAVGGQGLIVDGRLVSGSHGLAGELGYFVRYLGLREEMRERAWTSEGASMPCASTPFAKPRLQGRQPLRSAEGISLDTSAFPTRGNAFFCHPVPR